MTDPSSYIAIADGAFAPLYPYYARKILDATGIQAGICLDVGCGGGHLGLALAEQANLEVRLLGQSPQMLQRADRNIVRRRLQGRVKTICGLVEAIPLQDASVELVVSRGSLPFWEDLPAAFHEIARVLRPGGYAYVGGGLGPPELREQILRAARRVDPAWRTGPRGNIPQHPPEHYAQGLELAGIRSFRIMRGDDGNWIMFQKPQAAAKRGPSGTGEGEPSSPAGEDVAQGCRDCPMAL